MNLKEIERVCLNEVVTIQEAASLLSVTRKRVRDLILCNKLVARQSGSIWLISKASIERRLQNA